MQTRMCKRRTRGFVRERNRNANGEMLYEIQDRNKFIAANTIFKHKASNKVELDHRLLAVMMYSKLDWERGKTKETKKEQQKIHCS